MANVILFAYLLYINAAGKVASLHLMRQWWLAPGRLTFSFCLGWFLTVCRAYVELSFGVSEETLLLGRLLKQTGLHRIGPEVFWAPIPLWVMVGHRVGP